MSPALALQRAQQLTTVLFLALAKGPFILANSLYEKATTLLTLSVIGVWDLTLFIINILAPTITPGRFAKQGKPGAGGLWPTFIPPTETDSRAPCPGLNAMANHGILPRDGRRITMPQLRKALEETFNFSKSLTLSTTMSIAKAYGLNKEKNWIDLSNLAYHNIIEHDASLLRQDAYFESDQASPLPHKSYINSFFASASGPVTNEHPQGTITIQDLADQLSLRRAQSKRDNPVFSLAMQHKFFAASNASLVFEAFGGDVKTCRTVFLEEKFPEGYETSIRGRMGLTQLDFHLRSAEIALKMKEHILPPKPYR